MAQYAVFLYAPTEVETETEIAPEDHAVHERYSEEMQHDDVMVLAFELASPDTATSLRGDVMTDGPFLESKEVILGFYVIEAADLDEALGIARRNPILHQGGGVEVRPVVASVIPERQHADT